MVAKEHAPSQKERVRELAERLGVALIARGLLFLLERLLAHREIDL